MGRKKTEKAAPAVDVAVPRAYVQRVMTNLKTPGEAARTAALGPLTLIVGPSGAGKTTLVDSLGLALVGASPTRGLGKSTTNLKRALPAKAESLNVAVVLSTGETLTWSLGRGDKDAVWSAKGGFPLVGSGVLLPAAGTVISIDAALDLLLGYDRNRMLALLDAVPDTPITIQGLDAATESCARELAMRLDGVLPKDGTVIPAGQFRTVLATVEALQREYKSAASACELFKTGGLSGEEEAELNRLEGAVAAGSGAEFVRAELKRVELRQAAATNEFDGCTKLIDEAVSGYFVTHGLASKTLDLMQSLLTRMEATSLTEGKCPGCGVVTPKEKFEERQATFVTALAQLEEKVGTWGEQTRRSAKHFTELSIQHDLLSELLTTMGASESGVDEARLAELRHRRREAQLSIAAGAKLSSYGWYDKTLSALQTALLEAAVRAVAPAADIVRLRMNKVLPKGRVARIQCSGSKINIGQQRDGGPVIPTGALSGSERMVFAAALALALQPPRTTPVSLLVLDEVMFDRRTLKTVLAGLSRAFDSDGGPTQILVCASEWSGKVPAGWTLLEIGAEPENAEEPKDEPEPETPPAQATDIVGDSAKPQENPDETSGAPPDLTDLF